MTPWVGLWTADWSQNKKIVYSLAMPVSEAPRVPNASESATKLIREAIIDGRLGPGERLKEAAMARNFAISRTPVREALRVLQREGLVDTKPNRGAAVRTYTVDDLREIYALRALLEGHAARRAAQWMDVDALEALRGMCGRFSDLRVGNASIQELVKANVAFHEAVMDAAGSRRLSDVARRVVEMPLIYRTYSWYSEAQRRNAEHQHAQLVRAFEVHDADRAELIMKHHILEGGDVLLEHLSSPPFPQRP